MKQQVLSLIAVVRLKLIFFAYQAGVYNEAEASGLGTSNVQLANATSSTIVS